MLATRERPAPAAPPSTVAASNSLATMSIAESPSLAPPAPPPPATGAKAAPPGAVAATASSSLLGDYPAGDLSMNTASMTSSKASKQAKIIAARQAKERARMKKAMDDDAELKVASTVIAHRPAFVAPGVGEVTLAAGVPVNPAHLRARDIAAGAMGAAQSRAEMQAALVQEYPVRQAVLQEVAAISNGLLPGSIADEEEGGGAHAVRHTGGAFSLLSALNGSTASVGSLPSDGSSLSPIAVTSPGRSPSPGGGSVASTSPRRARSPTRANEPLPLLPPELVPRLPADAAPPLEPTMQPGVGAIVPVPGKRALLTAPPPKDVAGGWSVSVLPPENAEDRGNLEVPVLAAGGLAALQATAARHGRALGDGPPVSLGGDPSTWSQALRDASVPFQRYGGEGGGQQQVLALTNGEEGAQAAGAAAGAIVPYRPPGAGTALHEGDGGSSVSEHFSAVPYDATRLTESVVVGPSGKPETILYLTRIGDGGLSRKKGPGAPLHDFPVLAPAPHTLERPPKKVKKGPAAHIAGRYRRNYAQEDAVDGTDNLLGSPLDALQTGTFEITALARANADGQDAPRDTSDEANRVRWERRRRYAAKFRDLIGMDPMMVRQYGVMAKLKGTHTITPDRRFVNACDWSDDGALLLTAGHDGLAVVWDLETQEARRTYRNHHGPVYCASFSHGDTVNNKIATASGDGTARAWSTETGENIFTFRDHLSITYASEFSPDSTMLATASAASRIIVYNMARAGTVGRESSTYASRDMMLIDIRPYPRSPHGHEGPIRRLVWSLDGSFLFSASDDCSAKVWNVRVGGRFVVALRGHTGPVLDVAPSHTNGLVATASQDGTVKIWAVATERLGMGRDARPAWVNELAARRIRKLYEKGRLGLGPGAEPLPPPRLDGLNAGGSVASLLDGALCIRTIGGHYGPILAVAFSPEGDGRRVLTAGGDHNILIWETATGLVMQRMEGVHTAPIRQLRFRPDGLVFASCSDDGTVGLWRAYEETGCEQLRWKAKSWSYVKYHEAKIAWAYHKENGTLGKKMKGVGAAFGRLGTAIADKTKRTLRERLEAMGMDLDEERWMTSAERREAEEEEAAALAAEEAAAAREAAAAASGADADASGRDLYREALAKRAAEKAAEEAAAAAEAAALAAAAAAAEGGGSSGSFRRAPSLAKLKSFTSKIAAASAKALEPMTSAALDKTASFRAAAAERAAELKTRAAELKEKALDMKETAAQRAADIREKALEARDAAAEKAAALKEKAASAKELTAKRLGSGGLRRPGSGATVAPSAPPAPAPAPVAQPSAPTEDEEEDYGEAAVVAHESALDEDDDAFSLGGSSASSGGGLRLPGFDGPPAVAAKPASVNAGGGGLSLPAELRWGGDDDAASSTPRTPAFAL